MERVDKAIADDDGRPAHPFAAVSLLVSLERGGHISAELRGTGEDFQADFGRAHLDPLKAGDLSKPFISGSVLGVVAPATEWARIKVWRALLAVGGPNSLEASCLWHVLGWNAPLDRWAVERSLGNECVTLGAARILLAKALKELDAYYHAAKSRHSEAGHSRIRTWTAP